MTDRCLDTSSTELRANSNGKAATQLLRGALASAFVFLPYSELGSELFLVLHDITCMHGVAMLGVQQAEFRASSSSSSCFMGSLMTDIQDKLTGWTEIGFSRRTYGYCHSCSTC